MQCFNFCQIIKWRQVLRANRADHTLATDQHYVLLWPNAQAPLAVDAILRPLAPLVTTNACQLIISFPSLGCRTPVLGLCDVHGMREAQ